MTVLTPHAPDVRERWQEEGVEAVSFRYAPESYEVLGYSRSLSSDETIRVGAGLVTPLYLAAARRALKRLLASTKFDLLHAHWVVPNGLVAAPVASRVPLAIGLHGSDVFLAERPLVRQLVGRALGRSRLVTGCSPELVERVCALGFERQRARVIPYGVDTAKFSPGDEGRTAWRDEFGIPADAVVGLSVGRMVTKKGYHVLMKTLAEVMALDTSLHLVLAGGGDLLAELESASQPWRDRVHFPGAVLRDRLPDLYRAADFFLLPAVHDAKGNVDGLPNVILEAMATGLPVVASGISGIPLAITDGVEGLLVEEEDPTGLLEAISQLVGNRERRRGMGDAARARAESELTWAAVAARYRQAYDEALAEPQME
ncbi:MAG: glycosyltransferase family 4 protein [Acidobacteria bacterium]|nr:MAG: glycosyltransferase family 4 protein [Acidobacteriota bacterium]